MQRFHSVPCENDVCENTHPLSAAENAEEKAFTPVLSAAKAEVLPPVAAVKPKSRTKEQGLFITLLFIAGLLICFILLFTGLRLQQRKSVVQRPVLAAQPADETATPLSAADVVAQVLPSVVSIDLYESQNLAASGSGSGIILSADGYIATNAHVVHEVPLVRVVLHNGRGYTATVVGYDLANDLAVLKIDASGLTPVEFGNSDRLRLGEEVLAIGNATGTLPGTVTQGIVSGLQRDVPLNSATGEVVRMQLIQTDAAISPGSSGGALVDLHGHVMGISVGKFEREHVEGVAFAIPSNHAVEILQQLLDTGKVPPALKLGVNIQELNETTGPPNALPVQGLYIVGILPESSLSGQNVQAGDVIVRADGILLDNSETLREVLSQKQAGDGLLLEIFHPQSGQTTEINAVLYEEQLQTSVRIAYTE